MAEHDADSFISKQVRQGDYYFLDLEADPAGPLAVVCGGRELCGPNYRIDRPTFQYLCLEFVSAGHGQLTIAGRAFPLRPGSMFFYGPGIAHHISVDKGSTLVKYFVDFVGSPAQELLRNTPLSIPEPVQVAEPQAIVQIYEQLHRTAGVQRGSFRRLCGLLLEMLILHASDLAVSQEAIDSPSWATYQSCRRFIESRFTQLKGLDEVAQACGLSKAYICRIFKRYHSCSPYQFLAQMKMAHAASLLLGPQSLVKQVAAAVGFDDVYHFSKVFKRTYGISPAHFRRHRQYG